jgi:hypothetical protein
VYVVDIYLEHLLNVYNGHREYNGQVKVRVVPRPRYEYIRLSGLTGPRLLLLHVSSTFLAPSHIPSPIIMSLAVHSRLSLSSGATIPQFGFGSTPETYASVTRALDLGVRHCELHRLADNR